MTYPVTDARMVTQGGAVTGTSLPTTLTASGIPHAVGAWAELIASAPFNVTGIVLMLCGSTATASTARAILCNIGIGVGGSERVLVPSILLGCASGPRAHYFPIKVPAGSRISAQIQASVPSDTATVQVYLTGGGWSPPDAGSRATAYGAVLGTSSGTLLTAATGANAKSAFTPLDVATANPLRWATVCLGGPTDEATWTNRTALVDVAYGPPGSEQPLVENLACSWSTSESFNGNPITVPCSLPAGTRLAARYQVDALSGAPTERPTVVVIGVD